MSLVFCILLVFASLFLWIYVGAVLIDRSGGCGRMRGSCDQELGAIAEAVGKYPDHAERGKFLTAISQFRRE
jgi:hypothetical protein